MEGVQSIELGEPEDDMRSKQVDIVPTLNKETLLVCIAYHFVPQLPFLFTPSAIYRCQRVCTINFSSFDCCCSGNFFIEIDTI
jgi:hypothetical protein